MPSNTELQPVRERFLDLDLTKTFKTRAVLAFTDTDPNRYPFVRPEALYLAQNPVPVFSGYDERRIGYAMVFKDGNRLYADVFLDRECTERLDIETRSRPLYPVTFFRTLAWTGGCSSEVLVEKICIDIQKPFDDRVPELGAPVL